MRRALLPGPGRIGQGQEENEEEGEEEEEERQHIPRVGRRRMAAGGKR